MEFIETVWMQYPPARTAAALAGLALAAWLANFVVKTLLLRGLNHLLGRTSFGRDQELRSHGVIERLVHIVPAMVISGGIGLVPGLPLAVAAVVRNVSNAFIILTLALAVGAALKTLDTLYHRRPEARLRPLKGYIQVVSIAVYVIAALLVIATLIDRSPVILLSGLGAMAAVLILVFQDTLLSLVAGIQISSTDMVRVGDWIEMPGLNADGDVIEIALHTVKVQNFDRTITTIPIRKLVTDSFRNWRGMQESGGRRIKRALYIDQGSIRFATPDEVEKFGRISHIERYMDNKRHEISDWNRDLGDRATIAANTRRITNIGTFRAYVQHYLRSHPGIHQGMTIMVRQLQPGPEGLPVEIYCFASTIAWINYEGIQADIFDHLYAVLPEFGLRVFQNPTGTDFTAYRDAHAAH